MGSQINEEFSAPQQEHLAVYYHRQRQFREEQERMAYEVARKEEDPHFLQNDNSDHSQLLESDPTNEQDNEGIGGSIGVRGSC